MNNIVNNTLSSVSKKSKQAEAVITVNLELLKNRVKTKVNNIVDSIYVEYSEWKKKDKQFVMMVWYSRSWKSYYIANNPDWKYPNLANDFFSLETNVIHDRINSEFEFLQDDKTVNGFAYWRRQYLTQIIKKKILEKAKKEWSNIISDSCNLEKEKRNETLEEMKNSWYSTCIIYIDIDDDTMLRRCAEADKEKISRWEKWAWLDLYQNIQKQIFLDNTPDPSESDEFHTYSSNKK